MGQIGSVYKQPDKREDGSCHSWRAPSKCKGYKGKGEGIAMGAKGLGRKQRKSHAMYICDHNMCIEND